MEVVPIKQKQLFELSCKNNDFISLVLLYTSASLRIRWNLESTGHQAIGFGYPNF